MLQSKGYRRWNERFESEYRNAGFKSLLSISAFTTFATNKACGFECSQKNGRTSKMDVSTTSQIFSWFLEGTRLSVNTAQKKSSNYNTFSPPIHSACTLPKGLPTSQSQKRTTTHLIPPYLKSKETTLFSFCLFASFFFSFSDQEIVLLPVWGLGQTSALFFLCVPAWSSPRPGMHCAYVYGTTFGLD